MLAVDEFPIDSSLKFIMQKILEEFYQRKTILRLYEFLKKCVEVNYWFKL